MYRLQNENVRKKVHRKNVRKKVHTEKKYTELGSETPLCWSVLGVSHFGSLMLFTPYSSEAQMTRWCGYSKITNEESSKILKRPENHRGSYQRVLS